MNILTGGYKDNGGSKTLYVGYYSVSLTNRFLLELSNHGDKDNVVSVKLQYNTTNGEKGLVLLDKNHGLGDSRQIIFFLLNLIDGSITA